MKNLFAILCIALMIGVAFAAKPENTGKPDHAGKKAKSLVCHIENVYELDEEGNEVVDDDGESIVIDTIIETKYLPSPAVEAHLRHGDYLPATIVDPSGVEMMLCEVPDDAGLM